MPHLSDLLGSLTGANLNSTADQAIPMGAAKYIVRRIVVTNASGTPTLAAGGIYPAASKAGTALVSAAQTYTSLSAAGISMDLTLTGAVTATVLSAASLFLSLTTANGSALTADVYVFGDALS